MKFGLPRKDPSPGIGVVIISGSCCVPGMASLDEQARRTVEQAIFKAGVQAQVSIMPATSAYFGGAPKEVMTKLVRDFQSGQLGLPVILINGKAVSYGIPKLEDIKLALLQAQESSKEDANG